MPVSRETPTSMTPEAFAAWSEGALYERFASQIAERGLPCEAFPDGMAVRIDDETVFEQDVLVRFGPPLVDDVLLVTDPLIVIEVVSPSSRRIDVLVKLARYFRNPSIRHYLIVVPEGRIVIHHRRGANGAIETHSHEGGTVLLDPPGLSLDVAALFSDAAPA